MSAFCRFAANRAAHGDAVEAGQHQVEDHQVELARARRLLEPGVAIGGLDRRQLFESQVQRDQLADVGLVLDDQHAGTFGLNARHRLARARGLIFLSVLLGVAIIHTAAPRSDRAPLPCVPG